MKKSVVVCLVAWVMLCMGFTCFAHSYSYAEYASGYNLRNLGISIYLPGQNWTKGETIQGSVTIDNKANESEKLIITTSDNDYAWFGLEALGTDVDFQEFFQSICSADTLAKILTAQKGVETQVSITSTKYARETYNFENYARYDLTCLTTPVGGETSSTRLTVFLTAKNGKLYIIEYHYSYGESHFEDVIYMLNHTSYHLGEISIKVNGEKITSDSSPMILEGRTFVPIRAVAEKLGYTVGWDSETEVITINSSDGSTTLYYQIGVDYSIKEVNSQQEILHLDVVPFIYNGRTYLPLRSVGEAVGGSVEWIADSRTVIIKK